MSKKNLVTCPFSLRTLKHLIVLLRSNFISGLHLYTLSRTRVAFRDMQLRLSKVKTLLNNAFKARWEMENRDAEHEDVSSKKAPPWKARDKRAVFELGRRKVR